MRNNRYDRMTRVLVNVELEMPLHIEVSIVMKGVAAALLLLLQSCCAA
jgi:hypothetical protein